MKWYWLVFFFYIKKFKFYYVWIVFFKNKLLCVEYIFGIFEGSDLYIKYVYRVKFWYCSRWVLGMSLSCIRFFYVIVENVRYFCLL